MLITHHTHDHTRHHTRHHTRRSDTNTKRRLSLPPSTTPLGRYLRMRVASQSSPPETSSSASLAALIKTLPSPSYLEKDFDPLPDIMAKVPWGTHINAYLQNRISEIDEVQSAVSTHLNRQVTKHQGTLVGFSEVLTGTGLKVVEGLITASAGRRWLKESRGSGLGALQVLEGHAVRTRLRLVTSIVRELTKVCRIVTSVRSGSLTTTEEADAVRDVRDFCEKSEAKGLKCLEDVRENVPRMFGEVRARGISAIAASVAPSLGDDADDAQPFDWREYHARVQGVIRCEVLWGEGEGELGRDVVDLVKLRVDEGLMGILRAHRGDPSGALKCSIGQAIDETSTRDLVDVFRSYASLTLDVLHRAFLCSQCHLDWGGDDNDSWEYLHRRAVADGMTSFDDDLEESSDDEEDEGGGGGGERRRRDVRPRRQGRRPHERRRRRSHARGRGGGEGWPRERRQE